MDKYLIKPSKKEIIIKKTVDKKPKKRIQKNLSKSKNNSKKKRVQKEVLYKKVNFEEMVKKDNFNPEKNYFFLDKKDFPFFALADIFELLSKTKGKNSIELKKTYVKRLFEHILFFCPDELVDIYNFCCLRTDVEWEQLDLGIGFDTLQKTVITVTGRTLKMVRQDFREIGDLGTVLEKSKSGQNNLTSFFFKSSKEKDDSKEMGNQKFITFKYIHDTVLTLAKTIGNGSKARMQDILVRLLRNLNAKEGKYFIRFLDSNFKIGAAEKLFQSSLSRAFLYYFDKKNYDCFPKKPEKKEIDTFDKKLISNQFNQISKEFYDYLEINNKIIIWDSLFQKVITQFPNHKVFFKNVLELKLIPSILLNSSLTPEIPCRPMLAKPTKSLGQIFKRLDNNPFSCEYKYDGLRGQIHFNRKTNVFKIFSRNLENITEMYPDIAKSIRTLNNDFIKNPEKEINSFIIDTEIVAFDKNSNRILPFQVLSTRSKKNVNIADEKVSVCIYSFDILYLNGEPLIQKTYRERREKLRYLVENHYSTNIIKLAESKDCNDVEQIQEFLDLSVKIGCEGLMVKTLDLNSTYEPAKRSFKWLKVKKDYIERGGIGDSLDLVVIGANYGTGRRAGKFGAFLMSCYNIEEDTYEGCCLVGTGFSDEMLDALKNLLEPRIITNKPKNYLLEKSGFVDVWFEADYVWEIKGADIQVSPVYKCAKDNLALDNGRGLGIRFPRFIRIRDDKHVEDSTDPKFIFDLYKEQAVVGNLDDEDDYY